MIRINDRLGIAVFPTQRKLVKDLTVFNSGRAMIHGPVLDQVRERLNEDLELSESARSLYKDICTVKLTKRGDLYKFTFNSYPRRPWALRNKHDYHRFTAMVDQLYDNDHRKFGTEHKFMVVCAKEWLEKRGYEVEVSRSITLHPDPEGQEKVKFGEMTVTPREHQEENLVKADERDYRIVIGDSAGLGKTISAGMILYKLHLEGKVNRIIWIVPNTQLTEQIKGEMEDKFGAEVLVVTGESFSRDERLGLEGSRNNKRQVRKTAYEKCGFISTNWSLFAKDFAKDKKFTEHIQFDAIVFDEVHICKEGNLSHSASLEVIAPYRISLSGTAMPNGKWKELFDVLNVTDPPAAPSKDYFKRLYYKFIEKEKKKFEEKHKGKKRKPHFDEVGTKDKAGQKVNKIALKYMIPKISYHGKEDVVSGLPKVIESKIHIKFSSDDKMVFNIYRNILGKLINRLKEYPNYGDMGEELASERGTVNATMLMVWRDLQRFCSFGSEAISYRIDKYLDGTKGVYEMMRDMFPSDIRDLKKIIDKATESPKNAEIVNFVRKNTDADKFVIFCTEINPNKKLVFELVKKGIPAKVIMGGSNRLTEEEAEMLDQPHRFRDDDVQEVLDWFWMPWSAISEFLTSLRDAGQLNRVMVGGKEVKNFFYTDLAVNMPRDDKLISIYLNDDADEETISTFVDRINEDGFYRATHHQDDGMIEMVFDQPPRKVLVTTDKLQEGINLQDAKCMIFYDYPFSIRSREQRMSRVWRDGSYHDKISVIYVMNGIEYKIEKRLQEKYDSSGELGCADPSPVSMGELFRMM